MKTRRPDARQGGDDPALPSPSERSRWRWTATRRTLAGGGALAAVLSLGTVAAGAATPTTHPSGTSAPHGSPPTGSPSHGGAPSGRAQPTAAGRITALSGDVITLEGMGKQTVTVTYSSTTTFKDRAATSTSAALKVGQFIAVQGTKASDGAVTATSIEFGTPPPRGAGNRPPGGGPKGTPSAGGAQPPSSGG